ncbi:MAG: hypothetical protein LC808_28040, partial [Actinobacteria bacterium]|nr:hypothetical protein [Actinomycetota bacterium]
MSAPPRRFTGIKFWAPLVLLLALTIAGFVWFGRDPGAVFADPGADVVTDATPVPVAASVIRQLERSQLICNGLTVQSPTLVI